LLLKYQGEKDRFNGYMPEFITLGSTSLEYTKKYRFNKEENKRYNLTDHTSEVLGLTSQNITNFNKKDNWLIRWLAHIAI